MERHKTSSQVSIDKKPNTFKDSSVSSINKQNQLQNEIDNLIQHGILDSIVEYDSKLDFDCISIVSRDQILKQTRRQVCGLVWNSIRSPKISKLVHDDRSCAFVEILRPPSEWSRYDVDTLLLKVRYKKFLNGLALRDEFVRILQIILKRDFNEETKTDKKYPYEFKDMEFTRNTIQLVFNHRHEHEITLVISLVLLVELDVPCTDYFPEVYTALSAHEPFNEYFKYHPDAQKTRVTPYNSIKFLFDRSSTESVLCDSFLQQSNPLSTMLTNFYKLRKDWMKYVQRASKYASDTIKLQMHTDKHRQSACSINSLRSGNSNTSAMNKLTQNRIPLSSQIEITFEYLFSLPLIRLLFLTVCSQYKQFGGEHDNGTAFAIERALQLFGDSIENNYLEHPFFKNTNVLPDSLLTHELSVKIGIKKLVKEMQRDWKRNIRR